MQSKLTEYVTPVLIVAHRTRIMLLLQETYNAHTTHTYNVYSTHDTFPM